MAKTAKPADFTSILDRAPTEIEKPKPIPTGTYATVLVGVPRQDKSAKKQTPFVEFTHKITSAGEDVDPDELKEALSASDGSVRRLQDITMKNTFYLTEGSAWRLKQFLADCGFDVESADQSLREMIEETAGRAVNIHVIHEPSQSGDSFFAKIGSSAQAE